MPTNSITKFDTPSLMMIHSSYRADTVYFGNFG